MTINEEKILKKVLNEELGILNNVSDLAYKICKNIEYKFLYEQSENYQVIFKPFKDDYPFSMVFKFENYEKQSKVPEEKIDYSGVTYYNKHLIIINGYTIKGNLLKDKLSEVVQHELHHIFELHLSGKNKIFDKKKDIDLYSLSVKEAKDNNVGTDRNNIGYAIYLSFKFESNAFENGTYAYLMKQDINFIGHEIELIKKSMYYKRFIKVKSAYEFVKNNPKECSEIAEKIYKKNTKWLTKTVYNSLKMCSRQIGRALAKVRKDYDYTHDGNNSITV